MTTEVQVRQALERKIVRKVVRTLKAAGFVPVKVWDSQEYVDAVTETEVLDAVFAVDDSTIHFAPATDLEDWGHRGVYIVLGNGIDCLSDWHCGDSDFDAGLERVCDYINALEA